MSFDTANDFLLVAAMNGGRTTGNRKAVPALDAMIVMLANAGCINLVVSGTAPVTGQDNTVWLNPNVNPYASNGALSAWDGAAYVPMTPDLFSRLVYGRRRLTATTTVYVNPSTGSDTLGDGTLAKPFQTLTKANAFIRDRFDTAGFTVNVQAATGSYTAGGNWSPRVGGGTLNVIGDNATPANCAVTAASSGFGVAINSGQVNISGFKVAAGAYGILNTSIGTSLGIASMDLGVCGFGHMHASLCSSMSVNGSMTISGNAPSCIAIDTNAVFTLDTRVFTFTNSPVFAGSFFNAYRGARAIINALTTVNGGTVTGKRHDIAQGGQVVTYGQNPASYFPGSIAGTVDAATFGLFT